MKRVLRADATFWLNIGDSYNGSGGAGGDYNSGGLKAGQPRFPGRNAHGLKLKDLCGVPWRLALALQNDGWWLRSDIIWAKPNPMPESCTDRPTRSHEYVFLLTKNAKYFWDAEAVKEECSGQNEAAANFQRETKDHLIPKQSAKQHRLDRKATENTGSRNRRSVWNIPTAPFPSVHFATFPPAIPERCIKAGTSEKGCCPHCGAGWKRVVEKKGGSIGQSWNDHKTDLYLGKRCTLPEAKGAIGRAGTGAYQVQTIGWTPTCACPHTEADLIPATVLDIFSGAGTTGLVAAKLQRDAILCELKPEYCDMAEKRIRGELGMLVEIEIHFANRKRILN